MSSVQSPPASVLPNEAATPSGKSQDQDVLERAKGHGILLFDGDCAMCNSFVQRFMAIDPEQAMRYAPLQGTTAAEVFERQGLAGQDLLGGIRLVQNFREKEERVLIGSDAVLTAFSLTRSPARFLVAFKIIPRFIREWGYGLIAKNRYRFFGKAQQCAIPKPNQRHLLLP